MRPPFPASHLSRTLRALQIYGANTNVGKTVVSTILARALRRRFPAEPVLYLKPVSTGAAAHADDSHVARYTRADAGVRAECLLQYEDPVSPHLVAAEPPSDETLLAAVQARVGRHAAETATGGTTLLLETAGGVHSPTLSGTSQADLYRPLRLPVVLVADPRLGGISATVCAFEALHIRGYDVDGVVVFRDAYYRNDGYLGGYFAERGVETLVLAPPPPEQQDAGADAEQMRTYYDAQGADGGVLALVDALRRRHDARVDRIQRMPAEALGMIWYPFTQHAGLRAESIAVIDSAHGDFFQTYSGGEGGALLRPTFDGSASWWTQGLGHANPELTLAAAHAAGRYGHVMFAGAIHEPALELARTLLDAIPNPRLARVFYSDNGSTGCEVAVKMAVRAARARYGWGREREAGVIGLKGSYHGDTIGVMDCAEPGVFNSEVEWYRGRGYWFDFPRVRMKGGRWGIEVPPEMGAEVVEVERLADVFDIEKRAESALGRRYRAHILSTLERLTRVENRLFGAVMIEPLVLGAGGMLFCDPLFQHALVSAVRSNPSLFSGTPDDARVPGEPDQDPHAWSGLPVIFDEVFTGLYRLGRISAATFLHTHADIAVHAKLLTGGLLPLCATLASESVFAAFLADRKSAALLHGHSYTAHAVGCSVARRSVQLLVQLAERGAHWQAARADWGAHGPHGVWSVWREGFVGALSGSAGVDGVWALGSVLAVALRAGDGAGYSSNAAEGFLRRVAARGEWSVHARALGNVVYLMAGQTTGAETIARLQEAVLEALGGEGGC